MMMAEIMMKETTTSNRYAVMRSIIKSVLL
jgi:hypothetical protein